MQKDAEQLRIEFDDRARQVFFALYSEFRHSTTSIDRLKDESVFQQLQSKYVHTLKQHLENIAKELMVNNKLLLYNRPFAQQLPSIISGYTTELHKR